MANPHEIHVAVSLPRGFIWHRESSCSETLTDKISEADLLFAIRINYASNKSWKGISPEKKSSWNKLRFGELTINDGYKFFYMKYPNRLIQGLLAWLSFSQNVKALSFYTPQTVMDSDKEKVLQAIKDILTTFLISPQCLISVNSVSRPIRDKRADLSFLLDLLKTFSNTGKRFFDEKEYD